MGRGMKEVITSTQQPTDLGPRVLEDSRFTPPAQPHFATIFERAWTKARRFAQAAPLIPTLVFVSPMNPAKPTFAEPLSDRPAITLELPQLTDFEIPRQDGLLSGILGGHFYDQAAGEAPQGWGFPILNTTEVPMWDIVKQDGGVEKTGYPISKLFRDELGRYVLLLQKEGRQVTTDGNGNVKKVEWINVIDLLRDNGVDLDNSEDLVPNPTVTLDQPRNFGHDSKDNPLPNSMEEHYQREIFDKQAAAYPELKEAFLSIPDRWNQLGLPIGFKDYGNGAVVVACQRGVLQLWLPKTSWTTKEREVVVANGADIFKKWVVRNRLFHLAPEEALKPQSNTMYGIGGGAEPRPPIIEPSRSELKLVDEHLDTNGNLKIQIQNSPVEIEKGKGYTLNKNKQALDALMSALKPFGIDQLSFMPTPFQAVPGYRHGIEFNNGFYTEPHHNFMVTNREKSTTLEIKIWWNEKDIRLSNDRKQRFNSEILPYGLATIAYYEHYGEYYDPNNPKHDHDGYNRLFDTFGKAIQAVFP